MSLENTVRKAAKLSGDLGIRTLDLQANIAALAERVVEQAETVERIGTDADRLERDQQNVSVAAREAKEKASAAHDVIDDSTRRLSVANANVVDLIDHSQTDACPCGPTCEPVERSDGSYGWMYTHHSLDGREATE